MKDKLTILALSTYTKELWKRNDIKFSESKVKEILKQVGLNDLEARMAANWEFVITFYEEAKKTTDIDVLRNAIYNRLKHRKYMTEAVVRGLLEARFMKSHEALQGLHSYMNNDVKDNARKKCRLDILHYTVELVSYYEASKEDGIWTMALIKQEIARILETHYKDLKLQRGSIEMAIAKRQVGKVETLKKFAQCHCKDHELFASYLKAYIPELNKVEAAQSKEMTLEDSLEDLLNEMGFGEVPEPTQAAENAEESVAQHSSTKAHSVEKDCTERCGAEEENSTERCGAANEKSIERCGTAEENSTERCGAANENSTEESTVGHESPILEMAKLVAEDTKSELTEAEQRPFLQHMSEMAKLLGYGLHKEGDRVMPEAYYNALMEEKETAKVEIWRNLARVDRQAVLSELYNAYQNLEHVSKANLEAILGNFFTMLALEGIEVIDEGVQVGETVKVYTQDIMKDFILAAPTQCEGEFEGTLIYKAWQFKGKTMMPKVIKVKEEV